MHQTDADRFAAAWLRDWNAHDLPAILAHYAPDVEFSSPFAKALTGDSLVVGRAALAAYFALALERFPDLHFPGARAFAGAQSIVLVYRSVNDLDAAETVLFDGDGLVSRVWAHYRAAVG